MTLNVLNGFAKVEGDPIELALYTHVLLEALKNTQEMKDQEDAEKEADLQNLLMNLNFEELLKREMGHETGHPDADGAGGGEGKRVPEPEGNGDRTYRLGSAPWKRVEDTKPGESQENG